jgi:hypothetical protein
MRGGPEFATKGRRQGLLTPSHSSRRRLVSLCRVRSVVSSVSFIRRLYGLLHGDDVARDRVGEHSPTVILAPGSVTATSSRRMSAPSVVLSSRRRGELRKARESWCEGTRPEVSGGKVRAEAGDVPSHRVRTRS